MCISKKCYVLINYSLSVEKNENNSSGDLKFNNNELDMVMLRCNFIYINTL